MRITYVTFDTSLWGGICVVFQHLELLAEAGYEAFLTTPADKPDWYSLKVPVQKIEKLEPSLIPSADIVVATSWRTISPVYESKKGIPVHFCQGYEGDYKELNVHKADIDRVYSLDIPKLTISPHLDKFLRERFDADTYYIGQMLNRDIFFPLESRHRPINSPVRVLIVGPFEVDVKNIPTALMGVRLTLNKIPQRIELIRVSQFPLSEAEKRIIIPHVYHFCVSYYKMGDIYREADVFISTSKEAEGFGLPALEAMACGVPTILSKIPSYMSFDERQDYSIFVEPSDAEAVMMAIIQIVSDKNLRKRLIQRGLEVAQKFTKELVLGRLSAAFEEIVEKDKIKRTKSKWDSYHVDIVKAGKRIHWWDSPVIMGHCQRLITGNPETDIYKFLKENFISDTLENGLSICSGSGEFERGLIDRGICKKIDAYEIAEERAREGMRIAKEKGYPITFYIEDVNKALFKKNNYDIFFSWSALHHIENLEGVCENVREALKDGGLLFIQEFVGPSQFQWTDKQMEIVNRILSLLPNRLKFNHMDGTVLTEIRRPSIDDMNRIDPSEAVRSSEIIPIIERYFDVKMVKYFGGSIFNLLFNGIITNFDHSCDRDVTLIKIILLMEELLIENHILNSDYALIVAKKR